MLSPRLFIIFMNELESMLRKSEYRGISKGNTIEIFLLMYADDIALGDTVLELQKKIRVLEEFCGKMCFQERGIYMQIGEILLQRGKGQDSYMLYRVSQNKGTDKKTLIQDYAKRWRTKGGPTFMQFLPRSFAVVTFMFGKLKS